MSVLRLVPSSAAAAAAVAQLALLLSAAMQRRTRWSLTMLSFLYQLL
jgi:hypothetical protein